MVLKNYFFGVHYFIMESGSHLVFQKLASAATKTFFAPRVPKDDRYVNNATEQIYLKPNKQYIRADSAVANAGLSTKLL